MLSPTAYTDPESLARIVASVREAPRVAMLLDYDGSLVPIAASPELAIPDADLLSLLTALADKPSVDLHLVSGRPRPFLDEWFGHLLMGLSAEHGFGYRAPRDREWLSEMTVPADWADHVLPILDDFVENTPGSWIETKTASLAWHYRAVDAGLGMHQADVLRARLADARRVRPFAILEGKKVIEVRLQGVTKALTVRRILATNAGGRVIAVGDDATDEELFAALPPESLTIGIGDEPISAKYRVGDPDRLRSLLRSIAR